MGKRRKRRYSAGCEDTQTEEKRTRDINLNTLEEVGLDSIPVTTHYDEDAKLDELVPRLEKTAKKRKIKKGKNINKEKTTSQATSKSKKIVFIDDEPCEVPVSTKVTNEDVHQKKHLNDEEADVKDEDIDKFCEDLDEEDNKQYEDWVKLIEAKLSENKKSK